MKGQPHRLQPPPGHPFAGNQIDRTRPLQFRCAGRVVHGFIGDTILSALMASGIDTAGRFHGSPVALSARLSAAVIPVGKTAPADALPIDRTPATDGADYQLYGAAHSPIATVLATMSRGRSLGVDLSELGSKAPAWHARPPNGELHADLLVIGGGVAGMAAALAGAKAGLKVLLLEASTALGGHSRIFGTQDNEEAPEENIARLAAAIEIADAVTVILGAEVFALRRGFARAHVVSDGPPISAQVIDVVAPRIVIATGCTERLPIFAGNRLPGVAMSLEAAQLAYRFGVWPGRAAVVATATNMPYRLAMLAHDAGIGIDRIIDARLQPQSRFIEFSKAYGFKLRSGTVPAAAQLGKTGITLATELVADGIDLPDQSSQTGRLVVCGGFQPELGLWHMAGGRSVWNPPAHRLDAAGSIPGIAMAGSAAGLLSRAGCLASGTDAVRKLLGRSRWPVEDKLIDPLYETPDGPCPIARPATPAVAPAFLDGGRRLLERHRSDDRRWRQRRNDPALAFAAQALEASDIAAGVQLGLVPAASAGIVAQERVAMAVVIDLRQDVATPRDETAAPVPAYLAGRFGDAPVLLRITPAERRTLATGALVFASAEPAGPFAALGVVLRQIGDGGALALVASLGAAETAFVREDGRAIAVRLSALPPASGSALGAGASAP